MDIDATYGTAWAPRNGTVKQWGARWGLEQKQYDDVMNMLKVLHLARDKRNNGSSLDEWTSIGTVEEILVSIIVDDSILIKYWWVLLKMTVSLRSTGESYCRWQYP